MMGTLHDFIAMGGYGGFVWPAFGAVALVLTGLAAASLQALRAKERALNRLRRNAETAGEAGE